MAPGTLARLRILLYRARVRVARALRLPGAFRPSAAVGRDHAANLALLWDGRWFLKTAQAHGEEDAIARNSEVRVSFARTEMRLMLATAGMEKARDLPEALDLIEAHAGVMLKGAGGLAYSQQPRPGGVDVRVTKCAAFEGAREAMRRGLVSRQDQACVHCCDVWQAWFGALLPTEKVSVERGAYQGAGASACEFRFRMGSRPGLK